MSEAAPASRRRVAVVVGSGGLKCVSALGLWKVLARERIDVDMMVGCSGGSVYAAAMALGWSVEDCIAASYDLWRDRFRKKNLVAFAQILFPRLFGFGDDFGLIDDTGVNAALQHAFGGKTFDDAKRPLHIVATDLWTSERVVLSAGPIFDAVRASIAIPFALRPWSIGGRRLIDGGASDPLPIDVAIREDADVIVAMGFESALLQALDAPVKLALQASTMTTNHLLRATFAFHNLAHHAEVIPIMPVFDRRVGLSDTHMIPYLIEQGEIAAEREVAYLRRLLAAEPAGLPA